MRPSRSCVVSLCALAMLVGCGDDEEREKSAGCSVSEQTGCATGLACEEVEGGEPACFAPLYVKGNVFDLTSDAAIAGAHVVARDANGAALSRVAVSEADGTYALQVAARRDAAGKPLPNQVTLRADADAFATFPKAPREALPIDLSTATGDPPNLSSAATEIGLIPLEDVADLGSVSGTVIADAPGGTLVVAGGATGIADFGGAYTVFNVPAGDQQVRGYASGLQLEAATASVTAGKLTAGVDLSSIGVATAVVSGKVEIVNGGDGKDTSIILVVEDTFVESVARGEAPRGLRAAPVSGDFSIAGVPDGNYVVLAAFENDALVRDPDTTIGGTEIVHIAVSGKDLAVAESFKVTGALAVESPGANEMDPVSGTPTFSWADDSSEDHYELRVYDALGTVVWEKLDVPGVSGGATVSAAYEGPALEPGMIYQFRATSIGKASGGKPAAPISMTEDLRGVFIYE